MNINAIDGLILVNKPKGITSFELILKLKKRLGIKKIGHSGILDKEAMGLMLVCMGRSTKMLKYLIGLDKKYIGKIKFGSQTTTDDSYGDILKKYDGEVSFDLIKEKLQKYKGKIYQSPPLYSSIHINGERAYKIALRNEIVTIKPRLIQIYSLEILDYNNKELTININCSSGTYIRSIARDIGIDTNYFAHLSYLKRIEIGQYSINNSYSLDAFEKNNFSIISPGEILYMFEKINLKENFFNHFKNGKKLSLNIFENHLLEDKIYRVFCNENFLGLIKYEKSNLTYEFVY